MAVWLNNHNKLRTQDFAKIKTIRYIWNKAKSFTIPSDPYPILNQSQIINICRSVNGVWPGCLVAHTSAARCHCAIVACRIVSHGPTHKEPLFRADQCFLLLCKQDTVQTCFHRAAGIQDLLAEFTEFQRILATWLVRHNRDWSVE